MAFIYDTADPSKAFLTLPLTLRLKADTPTTRAWHCEWEICSVYLFVFHCLRWEEGSSSVVQRDTEKTCKHDVCQELKLSRWSWPHIKL